MINPNDRLCFHYATLGGGIFVEQVLSAAKLDREEELTLDKLVSNVAAHCDIAAEELAWPCRQPEIVRVKAMICYLATRCYRAGCLIE